MIGPTLDSRVRSVGFLEKVCRKDLQPGDRLFVKTLNSVYSICAEVDGKYTVTGGWFDVKQKSPSTTTIRGCTWGGTAIKVDIVAACGLHIEFGNRLVTSAVQRIVVLPRVLQN